MMLIFILSTCTMLLCLILTMLSNIIYMKSIKDREKMSPFECGFEPKSPARNPFSLRFFLIAIIFLIFDVEIALILPTLIIKNSSNMVSWSMMLTFFIIILILGLYHEWNQGALNWAN